MWEQIRHNQRSSAVLIVLVAVLLFALGYCLGAMFMPNGGLVGLGIAFVIWLIMSLVAFYGGRNIFLALGGARKIEKSDAPRLWNVVEEMTIAAGLPKMPDVYVVDDPSPNAFATGRRPDNAAVAVTTGLLNLCTRDELQGVVAHELGHIKNRDVLYMIMVGVMVGAIILLADVGLRMMWFSGGRSRSSRDRGQGQAIVMIVAIVLAILAPILAQLLYFACSRKREYLADASAAQFTRYPEGLASALQKLGGSPVKMEKPNRVMTPMYINNPTRSAVGLTSTHPPIKERVRILRSMAGGASFGDYDAAFRQAGHGSGIIPAGEVKRAQPVAKREPSPEEKKKSQRERVRQTTDMLWKLNKYVFLACACGTKLKLPPGLKVSQVTCPHCHRKHKVPPRPKSSASRS